MSKCGLVVEGGGTKIGYSAGVLKCLLDHDIHLPYGVGISSGAEVLLPYVSGQTKRLEITAVDSATIKGAMGIVPLFKEGSIFGLEAVCDYIEEKAPLDFMAFFASKTDMQIGVYNLKTHEIEFFGREYVDESMTLLKASCALLLLAKPYHFNNGRYFDAGLTNMIAIDQSIKMGCDKHLILSTKEEGYVRKPAPKWQIWLARLIYKDKIIAKQLEERHLRYNEQWETIHKLEKENKAMVLRPHKDLGVTRYTTDRTKLKAWFELGYQETEERIEEIKAFIS